MLIAHILFLSPIQIYTRPNRFWGGCWSFETDLFRQRRRHKPQHAQAIRPRWTSHILCLCLGLNQMVLKDQQLPFYVWHLILYSLYLSGRSNLTEAKSDPNCPSLTPSFVNYIQKCQKSVQTTLVISFDKCNENIETESFPGFSYILNWKRYSTRLYTFRPNF